MRTTGCARGALAVLVVVFAVVLVAVAPVTAAPAPPPAAYYGSLTVDGEPAPAGLTVTAEIGGEVRGSLTTRDPGRYGGPGGFDRKLQVDGTDADAGATVSFYVEGRSAGTTTWAAGDVREVPLSATGVPTPSPPAGGGSGGAPGGGDASTPTGTPSSGGASTDPPGLTGGEPVVTVNRSGDGVDVRVTDARAGGEVVIRTGSDNATGLDSISVTPLVNGSFNLTLRQFDSPPVGAPPLPDDGAAIGFIRVAHTIPDADVGGVTFRFDASKRDLADRGLEPADVTLYRLADGDWTPLATTHVGETDGNHSFEASSPGLSLFAIGEGTGEGPAPTPTGTERPSATTTTDDSPDESPRRMGLDRRSVLTGIAVLVVVGGGAVALRRRV